MQVDLSASLRKLLIIAVDDAFDRFDRLKELHTIAPKAEGQEAPYMVSLVVKDNSGTLQLLSKGSPDLILSSCSGML